MPRSIWNGVISFGMVSIPVKLFSATENKDIAFHQLHDKCDSRIKYQKWCPHCEKVVDSDEIDKGYEFARGQYVKLEEEDFDQLPLASKHTIDVSSFVKSEQIDPVYYEKSYYLEPAEAAMRPFTLFMTALNDMEMVGVAAITLRNKERLCALRPMGGTLLLDTLLYPDEVRVSSDTELPNVKVSEKELGMAQHLIELMAQDFDPSQYHDHYRDALKKVIEAKLEGKEIAIPEAAPSGGKVVDLMEALRVSVENMKSRGSSTLKDKDKEAIKAIKKASDDVDEDKVTKTSSKAKVKAADADESDDDESETKTATTKAGQRNSSRRKTAAEKTSKSTKPAEHKRRRKESA